MINHPPHYTFGEKFEVIDIIDDWGLAFGFCIGSAIKYIARAKHKGNRLEDLKKARWYINHLLECIRNPTISIEKSSMLINEYTSESNVIKDWDLDRDEGLTLKRLREAIEWNQNSLCETQTFHSVTLARNQLTLAIGKLTT
jgi:hypothetical protein